MLQMHGAIIYGAREILLKVLFLTNLSRSCKYVKEPEN
jgi:hypothetical protein